MAYLIVTTIAAKRAPAAFNPAVVAKGSNGDRAMSNRAMSNEEEIRERCAVAAEVHWIRSLQIYFQLLLAGGSFRR